MALDAKTIKLSAGAVLVLVLIGIVFWGYRLWLEKKYIPQEFIEAREKSAHVAEKIVFLNNQSLAGLQKIAGFDEQGNYSKALERVQQEMERNRQARDEALLLSSYLSTMAAYLPKIEPGRARALATEAISNEVNLVNHLIILHGSLNSLFEELQNKFNQNPADNFQENEEKVKELIEKVNKGIKAINSLNIKFNSLMDEFDKIYNKPVAVDK